MKWVFWMSVAVIGYTYIGYVAWLWLRARFRPRPIQRAPYFPQITVLMVVRNEERNLSAKIENLSSLDYPSDKIEFVVVSDGSTDKTSEILTRISDPRFQTLLLPETSGKASGLNQGLQIARGDIIVFTDARQQIEPKACRLLMENFADPVVGCASGELMLGHPNAGEVAQGMGLYWRIEKAIRELESDSGSVIGATGALYAVRRALLVPIPPDTILDDVFLPMEVVRQGHRVVFDGRARAWDTPNLGGKKEFARKVRTLGGNYQLLEIAPWLLTSRNPVRFEFVSHKLLRLAIPFALAAALLASFVVPQPVYRLAMFLQLLFYSLSVLGLMPLKRGPLARVTDAALVFVVLNSAALVAFMNFVTGRRTVWVR